MMPLEFMMIPEMPESTLDVPLPCYVNECMGERAIKPHFGVGVMGSPTKIVGIGE
jgi:hypothetical protein